MTQAEPAPALDRAQRYTHLAGLYDQKAALLDIMADTQRKLGEIDRAISSFLTTLPGPGIPSTP